MWSLPTCISCMILRKEMAYIQNISILSKDYPLMCEILLLSLQKFCTRAHIMRQSIKWSTHVQLPTKTLKSSAIQQILIGISFVLSTVLLESVVVSWSHVLCSSFDHPLKFFAQIHTGNNPTSFTLVWRCMSPGIDWNLCREWRFKPQFFYRLKSTSPSTASMLNFFTHIPIRSLLNLVPSTSLYIFDI